MGSEGSIAPDASSQPIVLKVDQERRFERDRVHALRGGESDFCASFSRRITDSSTAGAL